MTIMTHKKTAKNKAQLGRRKHSEESVIAAIDGTGGIITTVCRKLGCSRETMYRYTRQSEKIERALNAEKERMLDKAEIALLNLISKEDLGAICFYLKCQGKKRGYVEKQELEHSGSMKTEVQLYRIPDNGRG